MINDKETRMGEGMRFFVEFVEGDGLVRRGTDDMEDMLSFAYKLVYCGISVRFGETDKSEFCVQGRKMA